MQEFFIENNVLNDAQHGFVTGCLTTTYLLESLNDWTDILNNGNLTRVVKYQLRTSI